MKNKFFILLLTLIALVGDPMGGYSNCFDNENEVSQYQKNSRLQWQWAMESLQNFSFLGDERILDIGCGDGKITAVIATEARMGLVIGMDYSSAMIKLASQTFPAEDHPNLAFLCGDACKNLFYQQFDMVFSCCCLHWVSDPLLALKNIHDCLVPGGRTLIILPAKSPNNIYYQAKKLSQTNKWKLYFENFVEAPRWYFDAEEYTQLLVDANLIPIKIEVTDTYATLENKEAMGLWILPISPIVQHVPDDKRGEFLEDLIDVLMPCCSKDEEGNILFPMEKLEAIAQKDVY